MIKQWWKKILLIIFGFGFAGIVPIIPSETFWVGVETVIYDTLSGWMEKNTYIEHNGYYQVCLKSLCRPAESTDLEFKDLKYDVSSLKEVKVAGVVYYNKFYDEFFDLKEVKKITQEEYRRYGDIKDYPAPKKIINNSLIIFNLMTFCTR